MLFKDVLMKKMSALTDFEILLVVFEGRSVFGPAQRVPGAKGLTMRQLFFFILNPMKCADNMFFFSLSLLCLVFAVLVLSTT